MRLRQLAGITSIAAVLACGGDGGVTVPGTTTGSVRGTVTDNTGANVVGASVALSATGQTTRNTTTVADGSYTFTNVNVGTYTVAVTPPAGFSLGAGGGTSTAAVVAGQQTTVAAIVINRNVPGTPPNFVEVSMANLLFIPASVEVAIGGTVRFTNNDNQPHNASAPGRFATGNMNVGQSVQVMLATAGTVDYVCTLHAGMSGTIVVR
jgi:plastocyanin